MDSIKQVIVCRKDLNMRKGKIAAQVAHASMMFIVKNASIFPNNSVESLPWTFHQLLTDAQREWLANSFVKVVAYVASEAALLALIDQAREAGITVHPVIDEGRTEFKGVPTLTCAAFGPDVGSKLDPVTGHLPLL